MRGGTPGFQAERLVAARDSRCLTQVALAELINRTSSSISRWESGDQSPEPEALEVLARATNLPMAFFLRPQVDHGSAPMFFRSMASTTKTVRRRCQARLRWAQEVALALQEWVDLPDVNLPCMDAVDYREIRDEDIERVADECRSLWGLGRGPISDVLLVLENAGIVVIKEEIGTSKMDGLSNWSAVDNRPYILIARDKATCVRSRMDAAHELGHLVLHRFLRQSTLNSGSDFKEIERQAFYFAGAFLMPAESFSAEISFPSLHAFVALKERWKIAVSAMMMRCANLGLVDYEYQQRLWRYFSARGWRKIEPLDDILEPEEPRLLARSVRLLIEEKVMSKENLLHSFLLNGSDVESICGLPRGFMTGGDAEIFSLPSLKTRTSQSESSSEVIPFNKD